jgi:hypothetical protein
MPTAVAAAGLVLDFQIFGVFCQTLNTGSAGGQLTDTREEWI